MRPAPPQKSFSRPIEIDHISRADALYKEEEKKLIEIGRLFALTS